MYVYIYIYILCIHVNISIYAQKHEACWTCRSTLPLLPTKKHGIRSRPSTSLWFATSFLITFDLGLSIFIGFFTICSWFICKRICNNTKYVYNMHIIVIHIYLKSYIDGIHISHIYIFCIFLLQYSGWIIKNATNLQPPTSTRIFTFFLAAHSQLRSCLLGVDDWRSLPANVVLSHSCHLSKRWYHDTPPRHPGCCGTYVSIYCGTM